MDSDTPVCAQCARRLGQYAFPAVPELWDGYCPQCGGTEPLVLDEPAPRANHTEPTPRQKDRAA